MKAELIAIYTLAAELLEDRVRCYPIAAIILATERLGTSPWLSTTAQNSWDYWRDGYPYEYSSTKEHVLLMFMLATMTELDIR